MPIESGHADDVLAGVTDDPGRGGPALLSLTTPARAGADQALGDCLPGAFPGPLQLVGVQRVPVRVAIGQGREGLCSSPISEWRKQAEAGAREGLARRSKKRCSAEEVELDKLRRQNERWTKDLGRTQTALEIAEEVQALLDQLSESADTELRPRR